MDKKISPRISFAFSKTNRKPEAFVALKSQEKPQVQLIDCLEGQSIKIKDYVEEEKKPLVIPIRSTKSAADIVRLAREKRLQLTTNSTIDKTEPNQREARPDSELSIDELAARELIREAQIRQNSLITNEGANKITKLTLKPDQLELDGAIEATNEDYEQVPISDYGKAMLRGMGWDEGMSLGKDPNKTITKYDPELRPKGLGLGANKLVNSEKPSKKAVDKDGRELTLKKDAFIKIIAGASKGNYGQVQGFDDDTSRVIVKTAIGGKILALNEFLVVPVTREDYSLGSKVINNAKYEEYKELSDKKLKRERSPEIKKERSRCRSRDENRVKKEHVSSDSDTERFRSKSKKSDKTKKSKKSKSRHRKHSSDDDKKKSRHVKR